MLPTILLRKYIHVCMYYVNICIHNNRLLYEYGEILTKVSIALTKLVKCHDEANECQYFSLIEKFHIYFN